MGAEQSREEETLQQQLASLRAIQKRDKDRLKDEASIWHYEVEQLRAKANQVDEECRESEEKAHELKQLRTQVEDEKSEIVVELQGYQERKRSREKERENAERLSQTLRQELEDIKAKNARCRNDEDHARLLQERDAIKREVQEEEQVKARLETELEKKQQTFLGGFCRKRRPPDKPKPLSPPEDSPPPQGRVSSSGPQGSTGQPRQPSQGSRAAPARAPTEPSPGSQRQLQNSQQQYSQPRQQREQLPPPQSKQQPAPTPIGASSGSNPSRSAGAPSGQKACEGGALARLEDRL